MSRIAVAVLLVAAGLGIGLWLGFNPERRAAVEENWQRAGDSIARIQADLDLEPGSQGSAPAENESTNESTQTAAAISACITLPHRAGPMGGHAAVVVEPAGTG